MDSVDTINDHVTSDHVTTDSILHEDDDKNNIQSKIAAELEIEVVSATRRESSNGEASVLKVVTNGEDSGHENDHRDLEYEEEERVSKHSFHVSSQQRVNTPPPNSERQDRDSNFFVGEEQTREVIKLSKEFKQRVEDDRVRDEKSGDDDDDDDESDRKGESYDLLKATEALQTLDNRIGSEFSEDDDDDENGVEAVASGAATSLSQYHDEDDRVANDNSRHDDQRVAKRSEKEQAVERVHEEDRRDTIEHVTQVVVTPVQTISSSSVASDTPVAALLQAEKPVPIPARRADKTSTPATVSSSSSSYVLTAASPSQKNANVSGKFVMRSSSKPDVNSFINIIRQSKSSGDAVGNDELLTVIRNSLVSLENNQQVERKSLVKEVFVQAYERNVLSNLASPTNPSASSPVGTSVATASAEPKTISIPESVEEIPEPKAVVTNGFGLEENTVVEEQLPRIPVPAAGVPKLPQVQQTGESQPVNVSTAKKAARPASIAPELSAVSPAAEVTTRTIDDELKPDSSPVGQPATPQWKADVETRKKLKSYVVSHKPEQPLRLATVPEWKKQLSEKAKIKKDQSQTSDEGTPSPLSLSGAFTSANTPWKLELAELKKMAVLSPEEEEPRREIPEWLRIAEEKHKHFSASATSDSK